MKRILVTGISGFLGWHITKFFPDDKELIGLFYQNNVIDGDERFWQLDLADFDYTQQFLDQLEFDAIVHLTAVSKPALCAQDPDYSYKINVVISSILALYAKEKNIPYIFASTDLVFDGERGNYNYLDIPAPINIYGKQKYEAERRILNIHPASTIVRLPLMYGLTPRKENFLYQWALKLSKKEKIKAFTDEYRSPISGKAAASGIFKLLKYRKTGIVHFGGPERLSRYDMALKIAQLVDAPKKLVKPVLQKDLDLSAPRPADVSLINEKSTSLSFNPKTMDTVLPKILPRLKKMLNT